MHSVTEDDLLRDRDRILAEIKTLNDQLKDTESALRVFKRFMAPPPKAPREKKSSALAEEAPSSPSAGNQIINPLNMSEVVRKAIFAQVDEFTTTKIVDFLKTQSPDIVDRLPPSYISTLLWRLANTGKVSVLRKGEHGKLNVYALNSKK